MSFSSFSESIMPMSRNWGISNPISTEARKIAKSDASKFRAFGHNGTEIKSRAGKRGLKSPSLFLVLFTSQPISLSPLWQ